MKVNNYSYPYPVLGNGDDFPDGKFDVSFKYTLTRDEVILQQDFKVKNSALEKMISNGDAVFVVEVMCKKTFYRESFTLQKYTERFSIPSSFLRERVDVGFTICANKDIEGYSPAQCHSDYDGMAFNVEKGDVLGYGGTYGFIADKDFDPLKPAFSSFITIKPGNSFDGPMYVSYEEDKIVIALSKDDWASFMEVKGLKPAEGIIHASIVYPALTEGIRHILDRDESDYEEKNWYIRLKNILDAKKLIQGATEPGTAAQKILDNPLKRCFEGIKNLSDSAED